MNPGDDGSMFDFTPKTVEPKTADDIEFLPRQDLKAEIRRLRAAIRDHRDQRADDRCVEDDDRLYAALGDGIKCDRRVGDKAQMLKNCERFIRRRCENGYWPTYQQLEEFVKEVAAWECVGNAGGDCGGCGTCLARKVLSKKAE